MIFERAIRGQPQGLRCLVATIAALSSWDRTLGTRLAPAFRREEQAVLALDQDVVKVQEG